MDVLKLNQLGAYVAIFILLTTSFVFIFRLVEQQAAEYWTGVALMFSAIPIVYLIYTAIPHDRSSLYFIQLFLMLGFIIVELLLDYVFKFDFRQIRWMVIAYVMLFFASTGGMIGIASHAGRSFSILAIVLFLAMTGLAFYQRAKTGM